MNLYNLDPKYIQKDNAKLYRFCTSQLPDGTNLYKLIQILET